MRILVDTNVFIDFILQREGYKDVLNFFIWCKKNNNQTFITSMSFRDIEYVAMKNTHDKNKVSSILIDVYSLCSKVIGISADSTITALYEDYKDFEDELIIQSAKEKKLDAIVTNNIKDFENRGIPAYTPKDIVNSIVTIKIE